MTGTGGLGTNRCTSRRALAVLTGMAMALPLAPTAPASASERQALTCAGRPVTIAGTTRSDTIQGTAGPDVIAGLAGNDRISGGGGDDVICGGDGWDDLAGGDGDDRLFGEDHADNLEGGPGNDVLRGGHDYVGRNIGDAWRAGDRLEGGPGDDLLDPGTDRRPTRARSSDDHEVITFEDAAGPIWLTLGTSPGRGRVTGEGSDIVVLGRKELRIIGTDHDDRMRGSGRKDFFVGLGGDDVLRGRGGKDVLIADGDTSDGGDGRPRTGDDKAFGGPGADVLASDSGADLLRGGRGQDNLLVNSRQVRRVAGGAGDDRIRISRPPAGARLRGGRGTDLLVLGGPAQVDAVKGRLSGRDATRFARLASVESYQVQWGLLRFTGSHRDETVRARRTARLVATGGGGDDHLIGGRRTDDLDGGPGHDTLDGDPRKDRCVNGEAGTCLV